MPTTSLTVKYNQWLMSMAEKKLEKKRQQLEVLKEKKDKHEITPAKYSVRKARLDQKIRFLDARVRTYRGIIKTAST
jgi:hypothetical protein